MKTTIMARRRIKISLTEEIEKEYGKKKSFPKYTTQIMNLANQNAQGTRPRVVGQMSELIQECPYNTYEGWEKWYLEKNPEAIHNATRKIIDMVDNLREAINLIDEDMVKEWVEDLVLVKTATGFIIQELILKKLSEVENCDYRLATPDDESQGIDGYLGGQPVSIKPDNYDSKRSTVRNSIKVKMINYTIKTQDLIITWDG